MDEDVDDVNNDEDGMVEDNVGADIKMIGTDFDMVSDTTYEKMGPQSKYRKSLVMVAKKRKLGPEGIIDLKQEQITNYFHFGGDNSQGIKLCSKKLHK